MVTLGSQVHALLMTILAGITVGLLFDIYRVARGFMRPRSWVTWITDLVFWVVVTPAVFGLLLMGNWGELRFYVLMGLFLGGLLYFGVLSQTVLGGLVAATRMLGRGAGAVGSGVVALVTVPVRLGREIGLGTGRGRPLAGGARPGRGLILGRWRPAPPRLRWWPRLVPPHLARFFRR